MAPSSGATVVGGLVGVVWALADDGGRYQFDTVVPGLYPGRTRHLHVKTQAPSGRVLTTQLYFPGEAQNARDGIYREECLITLADAADGKTGTFTFVLNG